MAQSTDPRKAGREIKEKILPYVLALESSIEQMHFIKKISDAAGIPESALKDDLKKVEAESKQGQTTEGEVRIQESQKFRKDYIMRRLLGILFWQKTEKIQNRRLRSATQRVIRYFKY